MVILRIISGSKYRFQTAAVKHIQPIFNCVIQIEALLPLQHKIITIFLISFRIEKEYSNLKLCIKTNQ